MKTKEDILYDLGLGLDPKTDSFILEAMEEYAQEVVKNLNTPDVSVPLPVIMQVLKYCEDNQIYDKLGTYQNFYYKLNQIRRECEESNAR